MVDVSPEIYKAITAAFDAGYNESAVVSSVMQAIADGGGSYADAHAFAVEVGEILSKAFGDAFSADVLPEGRLFYNIAKKTVDPALRHNYDLIADVCEQIQSSLNKHAKIGIRVQVPTVNEDRINGILNLVSHGEGYEGTAWVLDEPIVNFSQSIVDDFVQKNADFHYKSGFSPRIVRTVMGGCCTWCAELAGVYDYATVPHEVFQRHEHCRCTVEYDPKDGKKKVQDVHTKEWRDIKRNDIIEENKLYEKNRYIRKELGLPQKAEISYLGRKIDVGSLEFDDEHINKERLRKIKKEEAISWIENSVFSVNVWDGEFERYFSDQGAAYVDLKNMKIRTAYRRKEFTENIIRVLEKIKNE